jgi:flavin reductase (DIM6/NTAB) family NADH-FMN oxidoreductase RutF
MILNQSANCLPKMTVDTVSSELFREAMSCVASAVSVVTTDGASGCAGMTVSSMCSVSDHPPSVLVCLNKASPVSEIVRINGTMCVNVLRDNQDYVSAAFAGDYLDANVDLFVSGDWDRMATGAPALTEALVNLDCLIEGEMLYGTHHVLIGRIQNVRINVQGDPLIYAARQYRALLPSERVKSDGVG